MGIPRFEKQNVNPRLAIADIGDAFQGFVHELLLPEHSQLHRFPGGGKDGGIDLIETSDTCFVVECKVVGEDNYTQIEQRWKTVKGHLEEHLSDANGPTKGQSQYLPWYSTDTPIAEYVFCVSAKFAHEQQRRDLRETITDFFHDLAKRLPHLSHLGTLKVSVIDWNDLCDHLRKRPHSIFRWFPASRPNGLTPLDEMSFQGTFRSYLSNDKLPYYSREEHLRKMPAREGAEILDEAHLLGLLEHGQLEGLILTGGGGVGKSRLMLEVGRLALDKGWLVLRISNERELKEEELEKLGERLSPETRVLLLIDYVETLGNFTGIVGTVNELNERAGFYMRYIATCRSSYYRTIVTTPNHKKIDLTPLDPTREWFENYRKSTVHHILTKSGSEVKAKHLKVCHNIPILAVFISYLHSEGRETDIAELIEEEDFGRWVLKRVRMSFGENVEHRDLALLITQFPVGEPSITLSEKFGRLFDTLATDGWIEKGERDEGHGGQWEVTHDVFADEILASYFRVLGSAGVEFIKYLLSVSCDFGNLRSAIFSLQRIVSQAPLDSFEWDKILESQIAKRPEAWREVRDVLVRTSLLDAQQQLALLRGHETIWDGVETEISFQNAVGWLARQVLDEQEQTVDAVNREILVSWIQKAVPHVSRSNYILNWGLRLCPELLRDSVLEWIRAHPDKFQTHFLLVAWLESDLPPADIASQVQMWLEKFGNLLHVSFVVDAWLDAGGDKEFVRDNIKTWLEKNKMIPEASFVYKGWLNAGGDKEFVRDNIKTWLEKNKAIPEAEFVYESWLDAGGDKEFVRDNIKTWLEKNKMIPEASFVYKSWLNAGGDKEFVRDNIKTWLEKNKMIPEASFVYKSWLNAGGDKEFVRDNIKTWLEKNKEIPEAEYVYQSWLDAEGDKEFVRDNIKTWLEKNKTIPEARFVYRAWLDAGGEEELVSDSIKAWIETNKAIPEAQFVYVAWLNAGGRFSVVKDGAIEWLHKNCEKKEAVFITKFLVKQDITHRTVKDVLTWCRKFPEDEDALWRLTSLGNYLFMEEISEDLCGTCEVVVSAIILGKVHLKEITVGQVNTLLCFLVNAYSLQHRPLKDRVDELLLAWLRHPDSFGVRPKPQDGIQRVNYFLRVKEFICQSRLNVKTDRDVLERFLSWVNLWDLKCKLELRDELEDLRQSYPAPGLWDIIKFRR